MREQCKSHVMPSNMYRTFQCQRSVWKDGYCKQHHPETVRVRREKRDKLFNVECRFRTIDYELDRVIKACVEWLVTEGAGLHPEAKKFADEIVRLRKQREAAYAFAKKLREAK